MGQVFIEYLQGLSDHIDVVKSGCVYSYYVNKRLYSSNMDAILAVDVYEPLSGIKVKSGIVMMESAGVVKRVCLSIWENLVCICPIISEIFRGVFGG